MLNFVLCDDNSHFLNNLEATLSKLILKNDFDAKVGFKSTKISEVLDYMNENKTDVLFLDIQLKSDKTGIDIAENIRATNKNIYFIFTTRTLGICIFGFSS